MIELEEYAALHPTVMQPTDIVIDVDKFEETMFNCLQKSKAYSWVNTATEIENLYKAFN